MTKLELALIMKIIDCHTKTYSNNYYNGSDSKRIHDVPAMRAEIIKHFEEVLREEK